MAEGYQANVNLLQEAKQGGAKKFIFISVLNGKNLRHLKICAAKALFVELPLKSGWVYTVSHPNSHLATSAHPR
jgi:hypothetical protein